jgi:hypothetical protein
MDLIMSIVIQGDFLCLYLLSFAVIIGKCLSLYFYRECHETCWLNSKLISSLSIYGMANETDRSLLKVFNASSENFLNETRLSFGSLLVRGRSKIKWSQKKLKFLVSPP